MLKVVKDSDKINVPRRVATCPVCDATLELDIDEWKQYSYVNGQRLWVASHDGVNTDCSVVNKEGTRAWKEHRRAAKEDWWECDRRVFNWLQRNYRFTMGDMQPANIELEVEAAWTIR